MSCVHGTPLLEPCDGCEAQSRLLQRQFIQAVMDGNYDRDGYTKAERKAARKKQVAKEPLPLEVIR
jgi:hypothetical protein